MAGWDLSKLPPARSLASERRKQPPLQQEQQEQQPLARLNRELLALVEDTDDAKLLAQQQEEARTRIIASISEVAKSVGVRGTVDAFGSFANGLRRGGSDLDLSLLTGEGEHREVIELLALFLPRFQAMYQNVTQVFQTSTKLVKLTDEESGLEVDFCVNNRLGVRNTRLLWTYCHADPRVRQLGWLVKDWVKSHRLVGTPDGYPNSYCYMLLVIHYLQQCSPPVVQNLQLAATEAVPIVDSKWGYQDIWDTKFVEDTAEMPRSTNGSSLAELLVGFFNYYGQVFDWSKHAVCIRLNREQVAIDKFSLPTPTSVDQWYVEDPFDLRHNLTGKCTSMAKWRVLRCMRESHDALQVEGQWAQVVCPASPATDAYHLKCRVSPQVTPEMLLEAFKAFDLARVHMPSIPLGGQGQAFLVFASAAGRRRAHTQNEIFVANCQLCMLDCAMEAVEQALAGGNYTTVEAARG